jgi:hypothetical protein
MYGWWSIHTSNKSRYRLQAKELLVMLGPFLHSYGPDIQATCSPKARRHNCSPREARGQARGVHSSLKFCCCAVSMSCHSTASLIWKPRKSVIIYRKLTVLGYWYPNSDFRCLKCHRQKLQKSKRSIKKKKSLWWWWYSTIRVFWDSIKIFKCLVMVVQLCKCTDDHQTVPLKWVTCMSQLCLIKNEFSDKTNGQSTYA